MERVYVRNVQPHGRAIQIVWYIVNLIELILLFRFILRFIGASTAAAFTAFIYNLVSPLVSPFQSMVPSTFIGPGVLDWNTLIAMFVYGLLGTLITRLFAINRPPTVIETDRVV